YSEYSKCKIVVIPVPFEKTTTWLKGTKNGPKAIIEASANLEYYECETQAEIYEKGIYTAQPINAKTSEEMIRKVYEKVKKFLSDNKFVVTLGGEHSVSIGAIKAHNERFENMSVLHLDAHSDRRDCYLESKYNHACAIARVKEFVKNVVSVGIRSIDYSEIKKLKEDKIFYAYKIYSSNEWIKEAVNSLTKNVYITIDLDVFDPSIMPSVGTPEPGGLGWYQVLELLKFVAKIKNIVGFDVVELCPNEKNKAPDVLAAKLIQILLCYKFYPDKIKM
ncbi:MAG: agmatinase, partial [Candidatus Aenigmatarchaeota archaeon]